MNSPVASVGDCSTQNAASISKDLMTVSQVACELGVSAESVLIYANQGLLEYFRLSNGACVFQRISVDILKANQERYE
jgi:predicted site-specific integrase-resolvase